VTEIPAPRPALAGITPCPHGVVGPDELANLGLRPEDVIDFSASTNPLGPSTAVLAAMSRVDPGHYPDDGALALRQTLAHLAGLPFDSILVGNGSAEIIWLLALAYLRPDDRALIFGPTFGEYARACRIMGVEPRELRADPSDGFAVPLHAAIDAVRRDRPRLVFICNPNNPTGAYLGPAEITELATSSPRTLVVIDEAYRSFVAEPWSAEPLLELGNVALLRSLTKDHALAGLRVGYVAASTGIIESLAKVRPPWSVNSIAQAAALAALADPAHLVAARAEVFAAKADLVARLRALGLVVVPGAANFLLVEVGDAAAFRTALLQRGCCVRDCASFGLPSFVRIGVRTRLECRRLAAAFQAVLAEFKKDQPVGAGARE
jgi:histidinol-phosphate aminotransferase